ncbi:electron transfer flavoprotein-ubiquinone oxidoreductase [candidate division KSB1 bacterium]|nr:MAG: electron transfer flavoprotein-ubiquinone oxidoreductase [candidate division KSB1 bacterium]
MPSIERETLPVDVLIVGAGPAGLACAYHVKQLLARKAAESQKLPEVEIMVLEKGREIGAHSLSGAVMDPRGIAELIPDFLERGFPVERYCENDAVFRLTKTGKFKLPWTPPPLQNHGYPIVSLNRVVKWLGEQVEEAGIIVAAEMPGQELLIEDHRVTGVVTGDKGLNKNGERKSNFEPGAIIEAKVTVLAEGTRGSLTKQAVETLKLGNHNSQTYVLGVKEVWELPKPIAENGTVFHSMGYPLGNLFGGSWIYTMRENLLSLGLVTDLSYENPYTDPHDNFQKFKAHPWVASLLEGGKMVGYGAKTIPEGGWYAIPRGYHHGLLIIGDAGGFLNSQRLKGIHLAIKSGMLAAETIVEGIVRGDFSRDTMCSLQTRVEASWIQKELWPVRNFHQSFEKGVRVGMIHAAAQFISKGRGFKAQMPSRENHEHMRHVRELGLPDRDEVLQKRAGEYDGKLTFDKLTDVYNSRTMHEEDQPVHLHVSDPEICRTRCREEFGNPCQFFCPAGVYEMVPDEERGGVKLQINFSNCVHCKTCDIMDPYKIITWVPPEGGGGPVYTDL